MKKVRPRNLPSLSMILATFIYILAGVFFLWGARQPDLDVLWFRIHELKTGHIDRLDRGDRNAFFQSFNRHPGLAKGLLGNKNLDFISAQTDGYLETERAWLLRADQAPAQPIRVILHGAAKIWPVSVRLLLHRASGPAKEHRLQFPGPGAQVVNLEGSKGPELIELRIKPHGTLSAYLPNLTAGLTVRLSLEPRP